MIQHRNLITTTHLKSLFKSIRCWLTESGLFRAITCRRIFIIEPVAKEASAKLCMKTSRENFDGPKNRINRHYSRR